MSCKFGVWFLIVGREKQAVSVSIVECQYIHKCFSSQLRWHIPCKNGIDGCIYQSVSQWVGLISDEQKERMYESNMPGTLGLIVA